jgi:23S rRNA pseudouridine2457 synthase
MKIPKIVTLTTDGKVSEQIRSKKVDKNICASRDGVITEEAIAILKVGVEIGFDGSRVYNQKCEARLIHEILIFGPR